LSVFQYLLENGNTVVDFGTLLRAATRAGHFEIIDLLMEKDITAVQIQLQNGKGLTKNSVCSIIIKIDFAL